MHSSRTGCCRRSPRTPYSQCVSLGEVASKSRWAVDVCPVQFRRPSALLSPGSDSDHHDRSGPSYITAIGAAGQTRDGVRGRVGRNRNHGPVEGDVAAFGGIEEQVHDRCGLSHDAHRKNQGQQEQVVTIMGTGLWVLYQVCGWIEIESVSGGCVGPRNQASTGWWSLFGRGGNERRIKISNGLVVGIRAGSRLLSFHPWRQLFGPASHIKNGYCQQ